jgi:hypothetical protein
MSEHPLASIQDDELLRHLVELLGQSRRCESDLVAHIGEVDERGLYAREAVPSMFSYCVEVLHLSEAEAYLRIAAARAGREHPMLLDMLADGRLHLSGIAKLAPILTVENRDAVLSRAVHRSKRQIEELVAELAPRPDVLPLMRRLPIAAPRFGSGVSEPSSDSPATDTAPLRSDGGAEPPDPLRPDGVASSVTSSRAAIQCLSPSRYKVQFTASAELSHKLERLRALMRSEVPDGDLGAIIERVVGEKLERLEARRFAKTRAPRSNPSTSDVSPGSRHIPAAVRRAVWERDGNRCRYVDAQGRRCSERHRLEYHPRYPFALGGDRSPGNICLMCRAHNRLLAENDYGRKTMSRFRNVRAGLAARSGRG